MCNFTPAHGNGSWFSLSGNQFGSVKSIKNIFILQPRNFLSKKLPYKIRKSDKYLCIKMFVTTLLNNEKVSSIYIFNNRKVVKI